MEQISFYNKTIDRDYVSGLSITYSNNPHQHIWTFASGHGERYNNFYNCPCSIHGGFDPPSYTITVSQDQRIKVNMTHIILMTHCGIELDV